MGTGHKILFIINEINQILCLFLTLNRCFYGKNEDSKDFQVNDIKKSNDVFLKAPFCPKKANCKALLRPEF